MLEIIGTQYTDSSKIALSGLRTVRCRGMYYVYLIECEDTSLYTGITTDVERRLREHQEGTGGHFTRARKAVRVVYTEPHPDRSSASKREAEIKKWPREKKLELIGTKD